MLLSVTASCDVWARFRSVAQALREIGVSAAVSIPLLVKDRNLSLFCVASCVRNAIPEDEAGLLSTIAQYFATALDRENTHSLLRTAKEQLSEHAEVLEHKVQERTASLQETVSELETFSYTIAHDLRAPARSVTGYCELMFEDFAEDLPTDARAIIQKIAHASRRMELLTRDLLEFSKISRQEIALATLELEPIIEDLTTSRSPEVRQAITVQSPLHHVRGHAGLLQHVFSNLLDNAIKFVRPGTAPKITIFSEVVPGSSSNNGPHPLTFSFPAPVKQINAASDGPNEPDHVRIWVRDEGIGIPSQGHQKIFAIFERGSASNAYEGTGIGLAIVARAIQRMGGSCGVESELGKGSRFWFQLPAG